MEPFRIRDRRFLESVENHLSPCAAKSAAAATTRLIDEEEHPYRTAFQRDRDRIVHSRAFRRLKHKRQVFLTTYGDHYRTRLTHTIEVSQLSRTMARSLGLNEDLVEAIALGHDLGHTPFGHIGEVVLHRILKGKDTLDNQVDLQDLGGFKHNYQSVRIVDVNEVKYSFVGLNLTAPVREGILKHTRLSRQHIHYPDFEKRGLYYELDDSTTLEGQIVAVCDEIAQRTHDLEDGFRAKYVTCEQIRELPLIRKVDDQYDIYTHDSNGSTRNVLIRALVDFLVTDVIQETLGKIKNFVKKYERESFFERRLVWFSEEIDPLQHDLDRFIMREIITKAGEERRDVDSERIIRSLFRLYFHHANLLPTYQINKLMDSRQREVLYAGPLDERRALIRQLQTNSLFPRVLADHVAGMTDHYAENTLKTFTKWSPQQYQTARGDIDPGV